MNANDFISANVVEVVGRFQNGITRSYEKYGDKFYEGMLSITRLSGVEDIIPVSIPSRLYDQMTDINCPIRIVGQLRTYNRVVEGSGRLFITIHALSVRQADESECSLNEVCLSGTLCRPPVYRSTPFGREICDVMLAVSRGYGKSDYIPAIAWGSNAQRVAALKPGDHVSLSGRIQSRLYEKKMSNGSSITRIAYEVSAFKLGMEAGL